MATRRVVTALAAVGLAAAVVAGVIAARGTPPAAPVPAAADVTEQQQVRLTGRDVVTGAPVALATFRGKPIVLNIWASWCPGCNAEAAEIARFAEAHPEVAFVGIDFRDDPAAARGFYRRYGWKFPSIADPRGDISRRLGLQGTPTTIVLDADHREVARIVGETDQAGLAAALEHAGS